jgi:hypothetical protein
MRERLAEGVHVDFYNLHTNAGTSDGDEASAWRRFNDIDSVPAAGRATKVSLCSGSRVDQMGLALGNGATPAHGGTGGTASSLTLGSGEYVTSAYLCQGQEDSPTRAFYAKFTTNLGNTLAGGTTASDCVTRTAPSGRQIAGFHGRSGDEVARPASSAPSADRRSRNPSGARGTSGVATWVKKLKPLAVRDTPLRRELIHPGLDVCRPSGPGRPAVAADASAGHGPVPSARSRGREVW